VPENNIWVISNFFENSLRYPQVKLHHCTGINNTGNKFATGTAGTAGVIDTGDKQWEQYQAAYILN
jgi:hypothetical protein